MIGVVALPTVVSLGDASFHGVIASTRTIAGNPLAVIRLDNAPFQIGVGHGSLAIPGVVESDDVLFRGEDIARSGLHYLGLGHWHSFAKHRFGDTWTCYPGAPEFVALDQEGFGGVALVALAPGGQCEIERRQVGRRRFARLDLSLDGLTSVAQIARAIEERSDPDLVLDLRLVGIAGDELDVDALALERDLAQRFFHLRVRDASHTAPAAVEAAAYPESTVVGRFARRMAERLAAALNAEGLTTRMGLPWTAARVERVRTYHRIPTGCPVMPRADRPRGDGLVPSRVAAALLRVEPTALAHWRRWGFVHTEQRGPGSPLWVRLTPEDVARLDGTMAAQGHGRWPLREARRILGVTQEQLWEKARRQELVAYRARVADHWEWRVSPAGDEDSSAADSPSLQ